MRGSAACEYLVEDGWGPKPWEGLHEFRALRLWYGLAKVLLARPVRTVEQEDGTRKPVLDPETLSRVRELTTHGSHADAQGVTTHNTGTHEPNVRRRLARLAEEGKVPIVSNGIVRVGPHYVRLWRRT